MKNLCLSALTVFALACSSNTESTGQNGAPLDECEFEAIEDCTEDGKAGTKVCEPGDEGYTWSSCHVESAADQCRPGDTYHCFAEGSSMRQMYGDLLAVCTLVGDHYAYPPSACSTPLVLAFDGQPVDFTRAPGQFDLSGRNMSIATDWVAHPGWLWIAIATEPSRTAASSSAR
jgi:hypothetical protein